MSLPIDFEEKVKQPPAIAGVGGYPYSISANHLMQNFSYAALEVDETASSSGLSLTITTDPGSGGHPVRKLSLSGSASGMPDGYGPEEMYICVDGYAVLRNFLTDNPDPVTP